MAERDCDQDDGAADANDEAPGSISHRNEPNHIRRPRV